jgi:hypothetical protein
MNEWLLYIPRKCYVRKSIRQFQSQCHFSKLNKLKMAKCLEKRIFLNQIFSASSIHVLSQILSVSFCLSRINRLKLEILFKHEQNSRVVQHFKFCLQTLLKLGRVTKWDCLINNNNNNNLPSWVQHKEGRQCPSKPVQLDTYK